MRSTSAPLSHERHQAAFRPPPLSTEGPPQLLRRRVVTYDGVEYQGTHPRLVGPETFERVQEILTARAIAGEHQWKHQHHLKGTVFCGLGGSRLKFTKCTPRHGGRYDYFVCSARHNGGSCDLPYLPAHRVDHFVARYYVNEVNLDAERVAAL